MGAKGLDLNVSLAAKHWPLPCPFFLVALPPLPPLCFESAGGQHALGNECPYLWVKQACFLPGAVSLHSQLMASGHCGQMQAKADSTLRCSQAVPHPSTNRALSHLTSEVGRDLVHLTRYGRQQQLCDRGWPTCQKENLGGCGLWPKAML